MSSIRNILTVLVIGTLFSCDNQVKEVKSLETELDSVSYAVGLSMSSQLKNGFEDVNKEILIQAIRNGLDSTNLLLDSKDIQKTIQTYFQKKQEENKKKELAKFEVYKKEGIAFLEANKTQEGVKTTKSGLQYSVLKEGKGKKAKTTDRVKVHYHGTTVDGTVFDSSVDRGEPASFPVNGVIKGWTEALQLMPVGSKWKLFVPYDLAYGERGTGPQIGPYTTLIFEVELISIN